MPVTIVGSTTGVGGTLAYPVGVAAGDFIIVQTHPNNGPNLSTGFTPLPGSDAWRHAWTRVATASGNPTPSMGGNAWRVLVFRHTLGLKLGWVGAQTAYSASGAYTITAPTENEGLLVWAWSGFSYDLSGPVTMVTLRHNYFNGTIDHVLYAKYEDVVAGTHSRTTQFGSGGRTAYGQPFYLIPNNTPPLAPTELTPTGPINRLSPQRFQAKFNDPDSGDVPSRFSVFYRASTSALWTEIRQTGTANFIDVPAGTFFQGDYEWQAEFADRAGKPSPRSGSAFFRAVTPPPGPTITAPTNGATIARASGLLQWSFPDQRAWRARSVADNAGTPNPATVYWSADSTAATAADRSVTVPFSTNGRWEHPQVQVQDSNGLWSNWSSIRVFVSYAAPGVASVDVRPGDGVITVQPFPAVVVGDQPAAQRFNIWRVEVDDDGKFLEEPKRKAVGIAPNEIWTDWHVKSKELAVGDRRHNYLYRVAAIAASGTASVTAWHSGPASPAEPAPAPVGNVITSTLEEFV